MEEVAHGQQVLVGGVMTACFTSWSLLHETAPVTYSAKSSLLW